MLSSRQHNVSNPENILIGVNYCVAIDNGSYAGALTNYPIKEFIILLQREMIHLKFNKDHAEFIHRVGNKLLMAIDPTPNQYSPIDPFHPCWALWWENE
jgi:hypothetical protein